MNRDSTTNEFFVRKLVLNRHYGVSANAAGEVTLDEDYFICDFVDF